ncbi:MAG: hypothetical protein OEY33_04650, partial [Bdellovibrionales bacterium]|nr:hypothetical protein [Bdellovibrionales bacterium]
MKKIYLVLLLIFIIPSLSYSSSSEHEKDSGGDPDSENPTIQDDQSGGGGGVDHGKTTCSWCQMFSFSATPSGNFDFDKHRFITYLGTNDVVTPNKKGAVAEGPYQVMDMGEWSIGVGVGVGAMDYVTGTGAKIGLNVSVGRSYRSIRIVNTYKEAKKIDTLKTMPKKFKDFEKLPKSTIISTIMSGGISVYATASAGYVASAGAEIGVSGDWFVLLERSNDYEVTYTIQSAKSLNAAVKAGLGIAGVSYSGELKGSYRHKFIVDLRDEKGREAYEDLMDGKITNVLKLMKSSANANKVIKVVKKDDDIEDFFSLQQSSMVNTRSRSGKGSVTPSLFSFLGKASKVFDQVDTEVER